LTKYKISIDKKFKDNLDLITKHKDLTIESMLEEAVKISLNQVTTKYIIDLYKEGKIRARDAWKRTGLDYQEFQNRVN
jgi:hypothetical protein